MATRRKRTPAENAAIYARRQERSKAIYGAGYGAKGGARRRRALNQVSPRDTTAAPRPVTAQVGGRTITKTTGAQSASHARAAIAAAAGRRERVTIQATFLNDSGVPRTRVLSPGRGPGGTAASVAREGRQPLGAVQITAGRGPRHGESALQVLRWIDRDYGGDVWDAFFDWWAASDSPVRW